MKTLYQEWRGVRRLCPEPAQGVRRLRTKPAYPPPFFEPVYYPTLFLDKAGVSLQRSTSFFVSMFHGYHGHVWHVHPCAFMLRQVGRGPPARSAGPSKGRDVHVNQGCQKGCVPSPDIPTHDAGRWEGAPRREAPALVREGTCL